MDRKKAWHRFKNILCVRLDNLGDLLMSTPAIRALKESVSGRKITLLTSSMAAEVASYIPEIDEIIQFDVPWVKTESIHKNSGSILRLIGKLKEKKFDAAVIFTVFSQNPQPSALLCYLAEIPQVLSYSREHPWQLISDWVVDREPFIPIKHQVERDLALVSEVGAETRNKKLSIRLPDDIGMRVNNFLKARNIPKVHLIILHPGASEQKRRYPAAQFAEIGSLLVKKGYTVVLTGTKKEKDITDGIQEKIGSGAYSVAGETELELFMGLIGLSRALISNNTGPVHIASALQTPVIVFYALTNPQHTPWMVRNAVFYFDVRKKLKNKDSTLQFAEKYMKHFKRGFPKPSEVIKALGLFLRNPDAKL